jgi:hypothetical protein
MHLSDALFRGVHFLYGVQEEGGSAIYAFWDIRGWVLDFLYATLLGARIDIRTPSSARKT